MESISRRGSTQHRNGGGDRKIDCYVVEDVVVVDVDQVDGNDVDKCARAYRVIALRKNISRSRGEQVLFDEVAGSDRSALPGSLPVGFPGPPAAPAVRFSPQRALHVS